MSGLTLEDYIGYALYKWMLISLSCKERAQHSLMIRKHIMKIPECLVDELLRFPFFEDVTGPQRVDNQLYNLV